MSLTLPVPTGNGGEARLHELVDDDLVVTELVFKMFNAFSCVRIESLGARQIMTASGNGQGGANVAAAAVSVQDRFCSIDMWDRGCGTGGGGMRGRKNTCCVVRADVCDAVEELYGYEASFGSRIGVALDAINEGLVKLMTPPT